MPTLRRSALALRKAICSTSHQVKKEKIVGPVVTLQPFDNDQLALTLTNDSLAATVWTQNLSRAHDFSAYLECGIIWVNC